MGGRLVRRLSGGGAVYHDLGNLNFTFIMTKDNYDVERQLEVIIKAVNSLGIRAVKSGRNDITVDGRKFSGNAFYSIGGKCYHHGTILVDVDMPSLSKYLNVSKTKLISKGVDSVRKRVTNLKEYRPELSMDMLKNELLQAFRKTYGLELARIEDAEFSQDTIKAGIEKFSSWEWNFGRKIEFSDSLERRFDWGDIELQMVVESGIIKDCRVYSDALDTEIFEILPKLLIGCRFSAGEMEEVLREIDAEDNKIRMIEDIITLIREEI